MSYANNKALVFIDVCGVKLRLGGKSCRKIVVRDSEGDTFPPLPGPHCLDYCSFLVGLEIGSCEPSDHVLPFPGRLAVPSP